MAFRAHKILFKSVQVNAFYCKMFGEGAFFVDTVLFSRSFQLSTHLSGHEYRKSSGNCQGISYCLEWRVVFSDKVDGL